MKHYFLYLLKLTAGVIFMFQRKKWHHKKIHNSPNSTVELGPLLHAFTHPRTHGRVLRNFKICQLTNDLVSFNATIDDIIEWKFKLFWIVNNKCQRGQKSRRKCQKCLFVYVWRQVLCCTVINFSCFATILRKKQVLVTVLRCQVILGV